MVDSLLLAVPIQLAMAVVLGRVMVSANAADFASLHQSWADQGRAHYGVLIIPQQRYSTGEIVRRVLRLAASKFELTNGLFYLSNF